jgi:hypothetical protein
VLILNKGEAMLLQNLVAVHTQNLQGMVHRLSSGQKIPVTNYCDDEDIDCEKSCDNRYVCPIKNFPTVEQIASDYNGCLNLSGKLAGILLPFGAKDITERLHHGNEDEE